MFNEEAEYTAFYQAFEIDEEPVSFLTILANARQRGLGTAPRRLWVLTHGTKRLNNSNS